MSLSYNQIKILFIVVAGCLLLPYLTGCGRALVHAPAPMASQAVESPESSRAHKDRAYAYFIQGRAFEAMGRIDDAAAAYARTVAEDGEALSVRYWLARYYFETPSWEKALPLMREVIAVDSLAEYLSFYSVLLVKSGRLEEARKILQMAVKKAPDDLRAKEMLASLFENSGALDSAIAIYTELSEAPETIEGAESKLLSLLIKANRSGEALLLARRLLTGSPLPASVRLALLSMGRSGIPQDSILDLYRNAPATGADGVNLKKDLATLFVQWGKLAQADSLFAVLTKEAPEAVDQRMYGIVLAAENKNKEAIGLLAPWVTSKSDPDAAFYLGNAYLDEKQYGNAITAYDTVLKLDSTHLSARMNRGVAFLRMERFDSAMIVFRDLVKRVPNDAEYDYLLGLSCNAAKEYAPARDAYLSALSKSPGHREARFGLGGAYERLGQFDEAEKVFLGLIAEDSLFSRALNYLGYMYADKGIRLDQAERMIHRALVLEPQNHAYLDSYGWVLFRQNRFADAETYLLKAAQSPDEDPVIYEHLAMIKTALNQPQQALDYWKVVLRLEPSNEKAKQALEGKTFLPSAH